jgi:tetratricopeptide (TPR) repeat protein
MPPKKTDRGDPSLKETAFTNPEVMDLQAILAAFQNNDNGVDPLRMERMCLKARTYIKAASRSELFEIYYWSLVCESRLIRHESAAGYAAQALRIAEELQETLKLGQIHRQLGWDALVSNNFENAERHFTTALEWILKTKDKRLEGKVYYNFAVLATKQADQDHAVEHGMKALEVAEAVGDRSFQAHVSHLLSVALTKLRRIDETSPL